LTYEAYTTLCMKSFEKIARAARDLPSQSKTTHTILSASPTGGDRLSKVAIHHRLGECPVGEASIVIAVSSPHRREAFEACEFILEEVKKKSQIWKREWYAEEGSDKNNAASWKENFPRIAKDGA
jgi:molybdopterin synthase catalytic subunit